jgi:hypothetical protein
MQILRLVHDTVTNLSILYSLDGRCRSNDEIIPTLVRPNLVWLAHAVDAPVRKYCTVVLSGPCR